MNKRITYLLATLLIAESALPISAQSLTGQSSSYPALNTTYLNTSIGNFSPTPRTTDATITASIERIFATEIASARAEISFTLHKTELKKQYTDQAASLHIALDDSIRFTSITEDGEESNETVDTPGVVTIHNSGFFTFHFTAKNIHPESILKYKSIIFKIPGEFLTCEEDLTIEVPIEADQVQLPTIPPVQTTSAGIKLVHFSSNPNYTAIRYTIDGSDVTWTSPTYEKTTAIEVGPSDTLKAVAYIGTMPSEPVVFSYEDIKVASDTDSDDSTSNNRPSDDDSSNSGSTSGGNSSNGGSTSSEDSSNSGSTSSDNSSVDQSEDASTDTPADPESSQTIADHISDAVANIIDTQKRDLTVKATKVPYGLTINNQPVALENKLLIHNGRTLAPLRTIAEVLNVPIHYHADSKTAIIQTENDLIEFPLGYNVAIVNGKVVPIDANDSSILSTIQNGRAYLPLRFIAEHLNLSIHFDGEQIYINSYH